ncbi:insulinase family protein [Microbispora sp. NPDC088329]|uniref:M16 family metallopeptidase n=1 Tax=Microbispora sp. NPDC088329 TaxID=3154869 RepID=UPI00342A5DE5
MRPGNLVVVPAGRRGPAAACLLLHTGAAGERAGREGLARVTASAVLDGVRPQLADLGATVTATSSLSSMRFAFTASAAVLPRALALVGDAIAGTRVSDPAAAQAVERRRTEIALEDAVPRRRALTLLNATLFHPSERHSRPIGGTVTTMSAITPRSVRSFVAQARQGPITLVTSVDSAAMDGLLSAASGRPAEAPAPRLGLHIGPHVADNPASTQVTYALALLLPGRRHSDWSALTVLAHVLGGGLASRLNVTLRDRRGAAYGLTAACLPIRGAGILLIEGSVAPGRAREALDEIVEILTDLHRYGPTPAELATAVRYLAGGAPIRLETAEQVVAETASLVAEGLPPALLWSEPEALTALDMATVTRTAGRHLSPHGLHLSAIVPTGLTGVEFRLAGDR